MSHKYLHKILDTSHITITNCPGEGVGAGQAKPTVGVGSQVVSTPTDEYDKKSEELDGLLDGGRKENRPSSSVLWGKAHRGPKV